MDGPSTTGLPDEPDLCFPTDYGLGRCDSWDEHLPPSCAGQDGQLRPDAPSWCTDVWCYVSRKNCQLPERSYDLAPSSIDPDPAAEDPLVWSSTTCSVMDQRAAQMSAAEIVPLLEGHIKDIRNFVEQEVAVVRKAQSGPVCKYVDSCRCSSCMHGHGSWRSLNGSHAYKMSMADMTVTHGGLTNAESRAEEEARCLAWHLEGKLQDIARIEYNDPSRLGWFSYSDQRNAAWYRLPGIDWCPTDTDLYDPRFSPWYAGAVSAPKDVVIILDRSHSMKVANRWGRAVQAAKAALSTLTRFDYATVVAFNTMASIFEDGSPLVPVTEANLAKLNAWLDELYPTGGADFEVAFARAFDAVSASANSSSSCNRVVLFLTDGVDDSNMDISKITAMNQKGVAVFTYSFGDDADNARTKQIACENKGIWYHVPDGTSIGHAMSKYYAYYAQALSQHEQVRWTIYEEFKTNTELITGCLPAFDRSSDPAELLGVACMDLSILIGIPAFKQKGGFETFMTGMQDQAATCVLARHSDQQLEQLRDSSSGARAMCGRPVPNQESSAAAPRCSVQALAVLGTAASSLMSRSL